MASSTCSAIPAEVSFTSGPRLRYAAIPRQALGAWRSALHGLRAWLGVAVMVGLLGGTALAATESVPDCRLELAGQPTRSGKAVIVQVRMVHVPDGRPVTGATVTALRFDMGPDGMAAMSAPAHAATSPTLGIYAFETRPSMPGNWALRLRATLPNHAPVEATLVIHCLA